MLISFIHADYTVLLVKHISINITIRTVQKITSFFQHTPSLNVKKMTAMLFWSKWSPYRNFELDIHSGTDQIESADTFKYFGIHLDNFFNFENHIDKITKKVDQKIWLNIYTYPWYISYPHIMSLFMMGVIKQRVIHYMSIQNLLWGQ